MKSIRCLLKEETGAAQMVEAAIVFPVAFLIVFLVIYLGLYILQSVTLSTYAQKVAILTSREVSQPGYHKLISDKSKYSSSAIELDVGGDGSTYSGVSLNVTAMGQEMVNNIGVAYRYWYEPLQSSSKSYYEEILRTMVKENSVIAPQSNGTLKVNISCDNKIINQYVHVTVEQELVHLALLDFFGIKSPTVSASAVATVSDTDELIRNTDFIVDAAVTLAERLGIDTDALREKVDGALKKLGLISK